MRFNPNSTKGTANTMGEIKTEGMAMLHNSYDFQHKLDELDKALRDTAFKLDDIFEVLDDCLVSEADQNLLLAVFLHSKFHFRLMSKLSEFECRAKEIAENNLTSSEVKHLFGGKKEQQ